MALSIDPILRFAVQNQVSDVHLKVGRPPMLRKCGRLLPLKGADVLQPIHLKECIAQIASDKECTTLKDTGDLEFTYVLDDIGRFRISAFHQRDLVGMVIRVIPSTISTIDDLQLPETLKRLCEHRRGLVLVTGAAGSGKTTTLAAMIHHINQTQPVHILTIEDPIEVIHNDEQSIVNQREVGRDTASFDLAVRAALRQNPDVLLIGEMRDMETMRTGLIAAETGHLVFSTLHTINAVESISRVITSFPAHQQQEIRKLVGNILVGVVSQRLVPKADGSGVVAALEIMVGTDFVRECIHNPQRTVELHDYIGKGKDTYGSQTFDQALVAHYQSGLITKQCAIDHASIPGDMKMKLSGISN
jgi:twitching motility protein PilT